MLNRKLLIVTSLIVSLLSLINAENMAYARPSPTYGGVILGAGSASGIDDVSTTTLFWGRHITDTFAVENALVDMGEFSNGKDTDDIAFDVSVLGLKRLGETTEIYFKGGLHIWNPDDSFLFGFGLNRSFGRKLRARLEWISYVSLEDEVEVEDVGTLSLGLYANF